MLFRPPVTIDSTPIVVCSAKCGLLVTYKYDLVSSLLVLKFLPFLFESFSKAYVQDIDFEEVYE